MQLFETPRAADEVPAPAPAHGRRATRIISAENISAYVPFAMNQFEVPPREAQADADSAVHSAAGQDARANGQRKGGERKTADRKAGDGKGGERSGGQSGATAAQGADAGAETVNNSGFEDGYRAGREAGADDGFKRGFEAGLAHADQQHRMAEIQAGATLMSRVDALCEQLEQRFVEIEREAADDVVGLALEVARQALRATLSVKPESIVPIVQEALSNLLDDRVRVHIHLNPADASLVRIELGERLTAQNCEIIPDHTIEVGGCRVSTPRADIDATMETRWRRTLAAIGRNADASIAVVAEEA